MIIHSLFQKNYFHGFQLTFLTWFLDSVLFIKIGNTLNKLLVKTNIEVIFNKESKKDF